MEKATDKREFLATFFKSNFNSSSFDGNCLAENEFPLIHLILRVFCAYKRVFIEKD